MGLNHSGLHLGWAPLQSWRNSVFFWWSLALHLDSQFNDLVPQAKPFTYLANMLSLPAFRFGFQNLLFLSWVLNNAFGHNLFCIRNLLLPDSRNRKSSMTSAAIPLKWDPTQSDISTTFQRAYSSDIFNAFDVLRDYVSWDTTISMGGNTVFI